MNFRIIDTFTDSLARLTGASNLSDAVGSNSDPEDPDHLIIIRTDVWFGPTG